MDQSIGCDDTKLFSTFWLYWDSAQQAHFLIETIEGKVLDPNKMQGLVWYSLLPLSTLGENPRGHAPKKFP